MTTVYYNAQYASAVNPVLKATRSWEVSSSYAGGYSGFASPFSGGGWWNPEERRYELFYRCGDVFCVAWVSSLHALDVRTLQRAQG